MGRKKCASDLAIIIDAPQYFRNHSPLLVKKDPLKRRRPILTWLDWVYFGTVLGQGVGEFAFRVVFSFLRNGKTGYWVCRNYEHRNNPNFTGRSPCGSITNIRDKNTTQLQRNRTVIPAGPLNTGISINVGSRFAPNSAVSGMMERFPSLYHFRI